MPNSPSELIYHLMQSAISVANTHSPTRSARQLGVAITTVYRHIDTLERSLGVQLFDRHHSKWLLRPEASALLQAGAQIEQLLRDTKDEIRNAAGATSSRLRIALSQDLATHYVVPRLHDFCQSCPGLQPELIISHDFADLARGEADVAIRPHGDPGDTLIGRRVCVLSHGFYGVRKKFKRRAGALHIDHKSANLEELSAYPICGYGQGLRDFTAAIWLRDAIAPSAIAAQFDCTNAMTQAVIEGFGIGLLPCFVGDAISSLCLVARVETGLPVDIWLITAAANRKRVAVKAFIKFFAESMRTDKALFLGKAYAR